MPWNINQTSQDIYKETKRLTSMYFDTWHVPKLYFHIYKTRLGTELIFIHCKWEVSRRSQQDCTGVKLPSETILFCLFYFILFRESGRLSHLPFSLLQRGRLRRRSKAMRKSMCKKPSIYKPLFYFSFSFPEHQMKQRWLGDSLPYLSLCVVEN